VTLDAWAALGILAVAILLFVTEWLRVDIVALAVVVALVLARLLSTQEALSGFSSPAVITIAALFVVGGGVMQTGLAGLIGRRILTIAGTSQARLTVVIMGAVAMLSAFMSDTGTVAVLLPAIVSLAWSARISPSKLLIPLSFGALLGGATTLIGTPPNIMVSDLLREAGLSPFGFFDYTPIGLLLLVAGFGFMLLVGRHLLPDHKPAHNLQRVETPEELVALYRLPDNLFRMRVRPESGLAGQTIAASRLRQDFRVTVLEILRPAQPRPVVKLGDQRLVLQSDALDSILPAAETSVAVGDILVVQGNENDVAHAAASWNLGVQPAQADDERSLITDEIGIAEVLLPPRSSLVGKNLVEARFGTLYRLTVLGIHRPGVEGKLDLKEAALRFGDMLLVQGTWRNILALRRRRRDFVVMGEPEAMVGAPARRKAPVALLILIGMLALMVTDAIPVAAASLLAALLMVWTGCLTIDEAYEAVDWKSIMLIAGMVPMSLALQKAGLVGLVAEGLIGVLGNWGPLAVLTGLFLLTAAFTQVLSNTATTVLVAPIGLAAAQKLGVQPHALLMAVAVAASMAFASPVASPVNTLVMGAGDYRFGDYAKAGVPLIFIMLAVTVLFVPLLWPL
jgi:di/tricarboxylate transporter